MQILLETFKQQNDLHHAYLLEGAREQIVPELLIFIEKHLNIKTKGNPDVYHREYDRFGIEDGRLMGERESLKSFSGSKKIFVVSFNFITREAQNALLKLFEEPTPNTHFFLVTSSKEALLPTLRSRLFLISNENKEEHTQVLAKKIIQATGAERLELVQDIIENKERATAISLLNNIEALLYKASPPRASSDTHVFDELQKVRDYLYDRSSSIKILLEHILLEIPAGRSV